MPRKSESEAISKHTLNLYAGDYRSAWSAGVDEVRATWEEVSGG